MAFHNRYRGSESWWWHTPRHKWHEYLPTAPSALPAAPACYVFMLDGEAVYVGQSVDLQRRIKSYGIKRRAGRLLTPWGELEGELTLKAKFAQTFGDWAAREARLIDRLTPRFNVRGA